ncbi:alpha/beta hydrolase [Herminiimonas fonticola]|uniref:Phospholipase/carboxylesterase n=1 Tax=Herminiimonas fonticola TaxID=303380 RepID=A0A4R6G5U5_9BURK|nr:alpha/beta hydrolase [Herminiimonas fonticola]RBA23899.1 putative esterase [Herminiimonas fonticola]TDN89899.1 phospholipase/carboxylesterase [Herminiimonas fonticola]
MTLKTVELVTAPNPTVAVIWMHGLGADGNDFVPIVKELDLEGCPAIRFVFPHAPMMEVTINGGRMMPAWFDISSSEFGRDDDERSVRNSEVDIRALIEREKERGIATDKILIGGFSQGCAMTLQTGLRYPEKLGGLLCLSGYLPLEDSFEAERSEANKNIPIYYGHGRGDQVIPITRAQQTLALLQKHGYNVEWHEYDMPHSVCMEEIDDISNFLKRVLA